MQDSSPEKLHRNIRVILYLPFFLANPNFVSKLTVIRNLNVSIFSSKQNDYIKSFKGFFLSPTRLDNGNDGATINDKSAMFNLHIGRLTSLFNDVISRHK